jgi:hypothetical protein
MEIAEIRKASGWLGVSETATPPAWLRAEILREAQEELSSPIDRRHGVSDRRRGDRGPSGS